MIPHPIMERLPAYYRESPGLLEPLVDVAEELLSIARARLRREEVRITRRRPPAQAGRWASNDGAIMNGTVEQVLSWLEARYGVAPHVWTGLRLSPVSSKGAEPALQLRRSVGPLAVLAWNKERLPAPPPGFDIPEEFLPVEVSVQAVLAKRASWKALPVAGERIAGEIFWSRTP